MNYYSYFSKFWNSRTFNFQISCFLSLMLVFFSFFSSVFVIKTTSHFYQMQAFNFLNNNNFLNKIQLESNHNVYDTSKINRLLTNRTGLGNSGEVYLMNLDGVLISESRFKTGKLVSQIPPDFDQVWSGIKNDYRGIPVFAYWRKISFSGFNGILASEIDAAEVFKPIEAIKNQLLIYTLVFNFLLLLSIPFISKFLSKNIDSERSLALVQNQAQILGQDKERERISYELHDHIGQLLTAHNYKIGTLALDKDMQDLLYKDVSRIQQGLKEIIFDLSVSVLKANGLIASIEHLIHFFSKQYIDQINFNFSKTNDFMIFENLPDTISLNIYRIIQELTNNAIKYSKAKNIYISLDIKPESSSILVNIQDDGIGFDTTSLNFFNKNGVNNVKSRVRMINGSFDLNSNPGNGTHWKIKIPIKLRRESYEGTFSR